MKALPKCFSRLPFFFKNSKYLKSYHGKTKILEIGPFSKNSLFRQRVKINYLPVITNNNKYYYRVTMVSDYVTIEKYTKQIKEANLIFLKSLFIGLLESSH